jgi:transcriptional regulator with XRE-family HTH domain
VAPRSLQEALLELRLASHWHTREEFSRQVGLSLYTYRGNEHGKCIPSRASLKKIIRRLKLQGPREAELWELWGKATLEKAGVALSEKYSGSVDLDALAQKILTEVSYALKQEGVTLRRSTERVVRNRVAMILKSALGA